MWVGLIVGLSVAALLLLWRLKQVSAEQIQTQTPV
jgi:hypothetical protein